MNKNLLESTLSNFLKAWEDKNVEAVVGLMSDDFEYFESPLDAPLTKLQQVRELWKPVKTFEAEVKLSFSTLSVENAYGIFRVKGTYEHTYYKTKKTTQIDRIFLLAVDEKGKITKFIQWREAKDIEK
jgi:ketosteroid isomerase-like protein